MQRRIAAFISVCAVLAVIVLIIYGISLIPEPDNSIKASPVGCSPGDLMAALGENLL
jgi:hypothetical protein